MTFIEIPLDPKKLPDNGKDAGIINEVLACRKTAEELIAEDRHIDALERVIEGLRLLRDFSDFNNNEFRAVLVALLFDLSEIHFELKDFKQSEKELEVLFRVLENLIKEDGERFGKYHVLAMELSTRILRSRKKTLELLVKQQINAGSLYDKVNAGVLAATDKLVDSLRNVGELLASTGDYRAAMKFYTEAIRLSKKRAGRVNRKEIKMTIEMAKIMMRVRSMRPRAKRLLNAVLPHAIALETIELEEDILALVHIIDVDIEHEPGWKAFLHKIQKGARATIGTAKATIDKVKNRVETTEDSVLADDAALGEATEEEAERDAEGTPEPEKKKNGKKNKKGKKK